MKKLTTAQIREEFLKFFEKKGCKRMPSSSLIPDDPSLLLTSAGMVQFKPYFLQQKKLDSKYIGTTTVQKCVRTNDIDIIGTTGRHLSFFEMLGNFSFGEYFKDEMCKWALEFSVDVMEMEPERLYFTVYQDDDETIEIWKNLGVPEDHISKLGEEDNFWRAGPTGPCGPCSELHYDQGPDFGCGKPDCKPGCDCDRYLEFWNLVFTQYDGQEDGTLKPLPKKNIDTGMGLERMAALSQGVQSNYETDILRSLITLGENLFGCTYGEDPDNDLCLRIIADHSRAVTFMIADGILPGNEGREYVLRRLLRRCIVHAAGLDYHGPFLGKYVDEIVKLMGDVYPEVIDNLSIIKTVILAEEERFGKNLINGFNLMNKMLSEAKENDRIQGEDAFLLHDTYGFPIEITQEMCAKRGIKVDMRGFKQEMAKQQERARAANVDDSEAAWSTYGGPATEILKQNGPTNFVGYDNRKCEATVIAIVFDGELVDSVKESSQAYVFLDKTPFYGEMGGQVGDTGKIESKNMTANVVNSTHPDKDLIAHVVEVEKGSISVGDKVEATIDSIRRSLIERNHTATHILHWALRSVLGEHVKQAGSLVEPERLRFDFTHFEAVSDKDLARVERIANQRVMFDSPVDIYNTTLKEARENNVTALFGEKYGDEVRVVKIGDFSQELCGGCHVVDTAEIGLIKITAETSVGANSRRIEACTSYSAYKYCNKYIDIVNVTRGVLRCPVERVVDRAQANIEEIRDLKRKLKTVMSSESTDFLADKLEQAVETNSGYKLLVLNLVNLKDKDIRKVWDVACDHLGDNCAVVFGAERGGKALLLAAGTSKAVDEGFNAGEVIKKIAPIVSGGGGGKPRMAQAGGKDPSKIEEALDVAKELLL